jgi:hypothetical protein
VATRQHGNITRTQLREIGLTDDGIGHRIRSGRLFRVHRGVFSVGRPPRTSLERARAALLACGEWSALSHESALAHWGFAARWPVRFEVTVTSGDPRPQGITVHRSRVVTPRDIRVHHGIRATSPARTILDCALNLHRAGRLTRVVNDALLTPFLHRSQLADVVGRFPTHPGAALLKAFATDADGGPTRSVFEDHMLRFCERYGLPRPVLNTVIAGHEADAVFVDEKVIVELDGWAFHRSREAFESDRDRDADRLEAGYATVRITWNRMLHRPDAEARRLARILDRRRPAPD